MSLPLLTYIAVASLLFGHLTPAQSLPDTLVSLVPSPGDIPGWSLSDSVRLYRGNALYTFIDGGADLFLEYGFRRALSAQYENPGSATIALEIYEMRDPGASYGIYSVRSGDEGTGIDLGREGILCSYYTMFWRGRYYVSVAASDSSPGSVSALLAIARSVSRKIAPAGERPGLMRLLPPGELQRQRYAAGPLGYASARLPDLAGIFPLHEAAIGSYRDHTLVIAAYDDTAEAQRHANALFLHLQTNRRFAEHRSLDDITCATDATGLQLCVGRSGRFISLSISSDASVALRSCDEALRSVPRE